MIKLAVNLALSALGIVAAALTQLALTALWPGIKAIPFPMVSLNSYVTVLLALVPCVAWPNSQGQSNTWWVDRVVPAADDFHNILGECAAHWRCLRLALVIVKIVGSDS
jgi:hypothetical protein